MSDIESGQMDAIELQRSVVGNIKASSSLAVSPDEIVKALQRTKDLINQNESLADQSMFTSSPRFLSESQRSFNTGNDVILLKKEALRRYAANSEAILNHSRNSSVASFNLNEENAGMYHRHVTQKHNSDVNELKEQIETLNIKVSRLRYDLKARDTTVEDLKVKISEMYVELELSQMCKKQSQHEIQLLKEENGRLVLENARLYEQSKEDRNKLTEQFEQRQRDLSRQEGVIDSLRKENEAVKSENVEVKLRAMKEKEDLIKHLEGIEQAIIQREKNAFNSHYEKILIESCQKVKEAEARQFESEIKKLKSAYEKEVHVLEEQLNQCDLSLKECQQRLSENKIDNGVQREYELLLNDKKAELKKLEASWENEIFHLKEELKRTKESLSREQKTSSEKNKELLIAQKQKFKLMAQLKNSTKKENSNGK